MENDIKTIHVIKTNLINRKLELMIMEKENMTSLNELTKAIMSITKKNNISTNPAIENGFK